jgi:hypothetical protein
MSAAVASIDTERGGLRYALDSGFLLPMLPRLSEVKRHFARSIGEAAPMGADDNLAEKGFETADGIGVGDINGDGRMDIVNPYGWWEQPPAGSKQETWTYHPEVFGRFGRGIMGGSVIAVYDVNGDGLNDVVTVLNPHGWGMAWFEQKRDASGKISFVKHMVMDDFSTKNAGDVVFSEPHGTSYADVDGDGIPDFIIGKRYWSHRDDYLDPDPYGMPVLYWFKTVRDKSAPGGARFVPELIRLGFRRISY